MGRRKTYEREDVARKAMALFWARGFNEVSTKELARHMGINVYSLFAEFESKQGLYEAALDLYSREIVAGIYDALDGPDAGLDDIVAVFRFVAGIENRQTARQGCFMCNTAVERAPVDAAAKAIVSAHYERTQESLRNALSNAKAKGVLRADVSCSDYSRLLSSTLVGLAVLTRAGVAAQVIVGAVNAAEKQIESVRA